MGRVLNRLVPFEEKVRDHNAILNAYLDSHVVLNHSDRTLDSHRMYLRGWFTGYKIQDDEHPDGRQLFVWEAIRPELANTEDRKHTIRIDTKLLAEVESGDPRKGKKDFAEELRQVVATVGKPGQPGEHVRCVVSVGMLTEGWDANNVTHILSIRAFGSQLLCEQVVGRGLRRMDYTPIKNAEGKELLTEEYVDVYGIPFSVIPFKGRAVTASATEDKPKQHVMALPERKAMEIRFPVVEG